MKRPNTIRNDEMDRRRHEVAEDIGATIKSERERRGWTALRLATRVGLDERTIRRIESGETCNLRSTTAILDAFGLELTVTRKPLLA